jgi:hypothetical protein
MPSRSFLPRVPSAIKPTIRTVHVGFSSVCIRWC